MNPDAFEQQLARGLGRLVAEAEIPDLTVDELLAGSPTGGEPDPTGRRRGVFLAVAAAVFVLAFGALWVSSDRNEAEVAVEHTSADVGDMNELGDRSGEAGDPFRDIAAGPAGTTAPRYVRSWTRTESGAQVNVMMAEQWYAPDGRAVVRGNSVEPLTGQEWVDIDLVHSAEEAQLIAAPSDRERRFGYPELTLATQGIELGDLASITDEQQPGVFTSVSNAGGESSYVAGEAAATARVMTRLLPTLMEPAARAEVLRILSSLPDASTSAAVDDLGRPSTKVTVPLAIVDPTSGETVGGFEVGFWFEPTTTAPHQIEWDLVDGLLGGTDISEYRETTVIVAAGEVATIPDPDAAGEEDPGTTVTTQAPGGELGLRPESEIERVRLDIESSLRVVQSAQDVLIQECMEAEGFEFFPLKGRAETNTSSVSLFDDPESWDPSANGYYPAPTEHNNEPDLQGAYLATLTPDENEAYSEAFFGTESVEMQLGSMVMSVGTDGCLGDARTELSGTDPETAARIAVIPTFMASLVADVQLLVEDDPAFQAAIQSWHACMSIAGFDFSDPAGAIEAADSAFPRDPSDPPSEAEVIQASTDRRCQIEAGTAETYQQRFVFHEAAVTTQGQGQELIAEWTAARDELLERSRTVLSDAGVSIGD